MLKFHCQIAVSELGYSCVAQLIGRWIVHNQITVSWVISDCMAGWVLICAKCCGWWRYGSKIMVERVLSRACGIAGSGLGWVGLLG